MTRAIDLNFEEAIKALERHVQTLGKVAFQAQNAAIDLAKRNEALEAALREIESRILWRMDNPVSGGHLETLLRIGKIARAALEQS